jgi:Kef-type K+ transport system membrane component KefB
MSLFIQLSIIMALAAMISLVFRRLKQPLVIGYILTGFIAGPALLSLTHHYDAFESFSQIGIVLLLFMIGLGLNTAVIKSTGKPVLITFLAIIAAVGSISFAAASIIGFPIKEALVVAVALLFSSTIIVIKSISDEREQSRLYSQIAIGILLVEDVAATLALLFVSASTGGGATLNELALFGLKGVIAIGMLVFSGLIIMPRLVKRFAADQELLYLLAIAWGFGVASIFHVAGFSVEVGALFAGVSLAHLPYAQEMTTRLKPLRDFFVLLFFIELGGSLGVDSLSNAIVPALIFSGIVMVTKPLIILSSLGALGYTKQTSFKSAIHLSQISEFSIILVVLAQKTGSASAQTVTTMTLTALITITLSAYLMKYDDKIYQKLKRILSVFERANTTKEVSSLRHYPFVLIGYQNGGHEYIEAFRNMNKRYVVIDYDPDMIDLMKRKGVAHVYGDATDIELLEELAVDKAQLVISNLPDIETNSLLLSHINGREDNTIFICYASSFEEAQRLYKAGASYVQLPHLIGAEKLSSFIRHNGSNKDAFERHRRHELGSLTSVLKDSMS